MAKILLHILFFTLVSNLFIQSIPINMDENEDIMVALARLHQEVDQIRRRLNPMPDLITFASNDVADRLRHYVHTKKTEEESDTVYVNLKVDPEEDVETEYVNLYIDTRRGVNAKYMSLDGRSNYINTRVVYSNINPTSNNKPYPSYPRYRRQRQTK